MIPPGGSEFTRAEFTLLHSVNLEMGYDMIEIRTPAEVLKYE